MHIYIINTKHYHYSMSMKGLFDISAILDFIIDLYAMI